jgi:hypothetical protein
VERSALAKEYRDHQQQLQSHVSKSILSLASVRKIVAEIMVHQAASLTFLLEHVVTADSGGTNIEVLGADQSTAATATASTSTIEMPEVVSLTWIKSSRSEIAALLSHVVDRLGTISCLQLLSHSSLDPARLSKVLLDESTRNVRQAKEYLVSMLWLDNNHDKKASTTSTRTTIQEQQQHHPIVKHLLQYREQLDALQAAIWACQQQFNNDSSGSGSGSGGKSQEADGREWWSRIRYLSTTVQAMEQEIQGTFFNVDDDDSLLEENGNEEATASTTSSEVPLPESGRYEHNVPTDSKQDKVEQTKTVVFRGEGVVKKLDRLRKPKLGPFKSNGNVDSMMLKPRDTVTERQMIIELQERVKAMAPQEDADEQPIQEDASAKAAREPVVPLFLGASGSLLSELKLAMPTVVGKSAADWEIEG